MRIKLLKITGIIFGSLLGLILIGFAIYVYLYYPRTAESFEIQTDNPTEKILIATQGSDFKDLLVKIICDSLKSSPIYVKGIDVSDLSGENDKEWDRILIINTFMIELNNKVDRFVNQAESSKKILLFVTSGGDDWLPQPGLKIDAITSASRKESINDLVQLIMDWLGRDISNNWEPGDFLLALKFMPRVDIESACTSIKFDKERYKVLYPNLVNLVNQIGYDYLRMEDINSALQIFKLNTSLFPDFWNVYDSYAEALLNKGNINEAIRNYRKALELNPNSESTKEILTKLTTY